MSARKTARGRDALACLRAGIAAVEPEALVREALASHAVTSQAGAPEGSVYVAALGKAAAPMVRGALDALASAKVSVADAVAVLPEGQQGTVPDGVRAVGAGHPQPTEGSVRGAEAIRELALKVGQSAGQPAGRSAGKNDILLVLISGGGSALCTLPPDGVSLDDLRSTTRTLQRAGASIDELNCVRKHLDQLKGGRLARLAAPARVLALVLSDVVGDPLHVIASGPVSPDPTTFDDALAVVDRHGLRDALPGSVLSHLQRGAEAGEDESPGEGDAVFERVDAQVVGNNRLAAEAALFEAERRGYGPLLLTTTLTGEARDVGRFLAAVGREVATSGRPVPPPAALLAAGETTVTVTGDGRGGRNQELALGAALELEALKPTSLAGQPGSDRVTVAALGTDGIDGPTDAAGAVADVRTVARGRAAGVEAKEFLARNDAYGFFEAVDDLVVTGATGTNAMDLYLVLVT